MATTSRPLRILQGPSGWSFFAENNGAWTTYRRRGFQRQIVHGPSGNWCENDCYEHKRIEQVCTCELTPHTDCVSGSSIHNWPFSIWGRWALTAQEMCALNGGLVCDGSTWHDHPIITTLDAWGDWIASPDPGEEDDFGSTDNPTRELGLWWGRSTLPTIDLNYRGADQRQLDICEGIGRGICDADTNGFNLGFKVAIDEVTNIVERTDMNVIGLDASSVLGEWRRYLWVQRLRHELNTYLASIQRGPWQGKLITESYSSDFTHTLEPTWFQIWKSNPVLTRPAICRSSAVDPAKLSMRKEASGCADSHPALLLTGIETRSEFLEEPFRRKVPACQVTYEELI